MRRAISSSSLFLVLLGVVISYSSVFAEDYNPPGWRGDDRTTYQKWEFPDSTFCPTPDDYYNPKGVPSLGVCEETSSWISNWLGQSGVWRLEDYIQIEIQNWPDPDDYKEIWLQMTYSSEGGYPPFVTTVPAGDSSVVDETENGDYWNITYDIIIEPNPQSETITIEPGGCAVYISEIVIDTICVPEPLTIGLLGLGGLILFRRRKR